MILKRCMLLAIVAGVVSFQSASFAEEKFSEVVGVSEVEAVKEKEFVEVPFLTWGGDVATFHANGGAKTTEDSIYGEMGLNVELVNGDDFVNQVSRYMRGETPFLRGTVRMIGLASEVIAPTEPVMFLQLTWSAGDHMVARKTVETLNDLKGKKVAIQSGGPHIGMLADVLDSARLTWDDIEVVWCKDLSGTDDSPAAKFRDDPTIDAAMCISPDMVTLTGGLDSKGSGGDGTVKDAHVLVSTATMSRSIADVYVCRKDFLEANREWVEKLTAGYLKATEELVALKKVFSASGSSDEYMATLQIAQDLFGKDVLPTLEADVHGLVSDCTFVGLPGNVSFFTDEGNLSGFAAKVKSASNLATGQGYADEAGDIVAVDFDWDALKSTGGLEADVEQKKVERFAEISDEGFFPDDPVAALEAADDTVLSFTINFEPNQEDFPHAQYGEDFQRALEAASTFGNSVIAVGGHGDPTKLLREIVVTGMASKKLSREGENGNYSYTLDGKAFDLEDTAAVLEAVKAGTFAGATIGDELMDPQATLVALADLSRERAESVKVALLEYAEAQGINLDVSQIRPVGVGVREPLIGKPTKKDEALENMRVEFRVMEVKAEDISSSGGFDF